MPLTYYRRYNLEYEALVNSITEFFPGTRLLSSGAVEAIPDMLIRSREEPGTGPDDAYAIGTPPQLMCVDVTGY